MRSFDANLDAVGHHLFSAETLCKRAEDLQKLRRKELERQSKNPRPERRRKAPRYCYGVRTDNGYIALRAFWSIHLEAMNFSGKGLAGYAQRSDFRPTRCASGAIAWTNPATKWSRDLLLHPSAQAQLRSAANCARAATMA
jgi:hypothetical protein